jgi:hypothetical protein
MSEMHLSTEALTDCDDGIEKQRSSPSRVPGISRGISVTICGRFLVLVLVLVLILILILIILYFEILGKE